MNLTAVPTYLPFAGGRFRLAMGLASVPEHAWFEIDRNLPVDLAAKRELLESRHDEVFCVLPEAGESAAALLCLMAAHLPQHHPAVFSDVAGRLYNRATGEEWDLARLPFHPLDVAARLVQEDICVLQPDNGRHVLVGASLCSPARWRLADKIGRPLDAIHAPVPGYHEALGHTVGRFFEVLKPNRLVHRFNWGIVDDPAPFQPTGRPVAAVSAVEVGAKLWLRVERQTLRRLPETGAVIFTIRTYITRLDSAIRSAQDAQDLAVALRDMPPETQQYKQITPAVPALLAWLDQRGGASPHA